MKDKDEFDKFGEVIYGLLAVPYKELQRKLEEEKRAKDKQKKRRATTSPAPLASDAKHKR